MEWFGRSTNPYPFEIFSVSHFMVMAIFVIFTICLYFFREKIKSFNLRRFEIAAAIILALIELTYHFWMYMNGAWNVSHALPLELCSISLIFSIILLLKRNRFLFEIVFFTTILGSAQAVFTPTLQYGFPHIRFFHFFFTHMMVVWVALYFTWVKEYRPTIWSVVKLFVFMNILLPIILFINKITYGNYLYLSHKPNSPSLFDILGPHPWYILSAEGFLVVLSLFVWLLFREKAGTAKLKVKKYDVQKSSV
jgi:hypothetical integral membrane protein (TIGR02206 family)